MEWLLLVVAAGAGAWGARLVRRRRTTSRELEQELAGVRRLADEDVTVFGEELRRLDARVGEHPLDEDGRADYQRALDAYESAQRAVPRLRDPDEVSAVTDTLSAGRYALACVEARVAGRPLPELRTPCFFNPQHGPSTTDVEWTSTRYGTRLVPACAQDAARLAAHQQPQVRTVTIGARTVPYWAAGSSYLPYSRGYFDVEPMQNVAGAGMVWAWLAKGGLEQGGYQHHGHVGGDVGGGFGGGDFGGGLGGGDVGGGGDGGGGSW
jgi:hypothetical protein